MDPFTAAGSIPFAGIASCFKLAEFAVSLADVGPESQVFIRLIQIVRIDLLETERLLSTPAIRERLDRIPHKLEWARGAIHNTKFALNEIGKLVENARVEKQTKGTVQFSTRVRWVLQDHSKIMNRQAELSACHQQLSNVLQQLASLELHSTQLTLLSPEHKQPYHAVIAPRERRKSHLSKQKSMSSIAGKTEYAKTERPAIGASVKQFHTDDKPDEQKHTNGLQPPILNTPEMDDSNNTRPGIRYSQSMPSATSSVTNPLNPPPPYTSVEDLLGIFASSHPIRQSAVEVQPTGTNAAGLTASRSNLAGTLQTTVSTESLPTIHANIESHAVSPLSRTGPRFRARSARG